MTYALTPEELEAAAILAVARTRNVQLVSDALGEVGEAIDALPGELFPGGLNMTLASLKQQVESIRAALKRDYGTTYVSAYGND